MFEKVGIIDQVVMAGSEDVSLVKPYLTMIEQYRQQGILGDEKIQYAPKELAAVISLIRQVDSRKYLALDSANTGGHKFIARKTNIDTLDHMDIQNDKTKERKFLRELTGVYDLVSIDTREYSLDAEEIWLYIIGFKDDAKVFGKGQPVNYGIRKIVPKGLVLVNFTNEEDKKFFYKLRRRYIKAYQGQFCGLIKL